MNRKLARAAAACLLAVPAAATACPFCAAPSLTLAEQVDRAEIALFVTWKDATKPTADLREDAATRFEVLEALPGRDGGVEPGATVATIDYVPAEPGRTYLLTGYFDTVDEVVRWDPPEPLPREAFGYVRDVPPLDLPTPERLRYYVRFLEHPVATIANDAYGEFANAPFEQITSVSETFPREKLARWVADEATDPARLGLYGLLLGACATEAETDLLGEIVLAPADDIRIGMNGIMSGYLYAAREPGLRKLTERKLAAATVPGPDGEPHEVPFSETYAAMQAVGFLWEYARDRFEDDAIRAAMRTLLDRPDLADFAIRDLARWRDWTVGDRLYAMYDDDGIAPAVRRAIVRYFLAAKKDRGDGGGIPRHVADARRYLAELEKTDPATVEDVRSYDLLFD